MKIKSIHIKNFRSLKDVLVNLDGYTSLVGANGAGKSTILCALNIFFRETDGISANAGELDLEDFNSKDGQTPIEITIVFGGLSPEAQEDFSDYFRQDQLIITAKATFDKVSNVATVRQFGQRLAIKEFARYFELYNSGASAADLKEVFAAIRKDFSGIKNASTKEAMREALREFEEANPKNCTLIPSEDQFYGFSRGSNRLAKYVQWIYVPAVKDATKENVEGRNTALGRILARTVRAKVNFDDKIKTLQEDTLKKYRELLDAQQGALDDISSSLTERMKDWAHPEARAKVAWTEDPRKSVQVEQPIARLIAGEGQFNGELARFGHGLQRSYLLALLQELASTNDTGAPTLLLGCEEPELYQHPPQAKHLASVLERLSNGNAQVVVSTHSPFFVSGRFFESVRLVRRDNVTQQSSVHCVKFDDVAARISEVTGEKPDKAAAQAARLHQILQPQLSEMFFSSRLVLVEGLEDVAYITSWLLLTDRWDEYRRSGMHIVPVNGKSYLIEPIVISQSLGVPLYVVFDADGNNTNPNHRRKHEEDNKAILSLLGGDASDPFPKQTVWAQSFVQWPSNFGDVLRHEIGQGDWDKTFGIATKNLGNPEGSYAKNSIHIGDHLSQLQKNKLTPPSLQKLCDEIMKFGSV